MIVIAKTIERRSLMKAIGVVIITLVFGGIAFGGETCTISGDVGFQYDGDIYICLFTVEKYAEFQRPGYDLSNPECTYIKLNADLKKAEQVSFKFESIPKGTYTIVSYQDENNNGKVDFENYMINEPWGTYKEGNLLGYPTWDLIKFKLEESISGIKIQI
jgi:uncharacterized protein (DUF2141 family)